MDIAGRIATILLLGALRSAFAQECSAIVPVLSEPLPDPYVFRSAGEWNIFGTSSTFQHGKALRPDAMVREDLHLSFADPATQPAGGFWGFTPYHHTDGSWHGYATLHLGGFRTVIGHFLPEAGSTWTTRQPIARWKLDKVLVGDVAAGRTTAYESKVVQDERGRLHLIYSASASPGQDVHIWAQRLLDPGTVDPASPPRSLLDPGGYRSEDRNPGYIQLVEGANVARIGSMYVLLYSVGDFARNNYKLGVAYSDTLIPPPGQTYRKVLVPDPQNVWKNTDKTNEVCYLLQSEHPNWPNYCGALVSGPGLGNLVTEDGAYRLVFHAFRADDPQRSPDDRRVWKVPVRVDVNRRLPMSGWLRPELGLTEGRRPQQK